MTGKTHIAIGLCFGTAACYISHTAPEAAAVVGGAVLGSLMPDVDIASSMAGRALFVVSYPMHWISGLFGHGKSRVAQHISESFGHRGMTHSPIWSLLPLILLFFDIPILLKMFLAGDAVGRISHIYSDVFNPTGVPLLWPIKTRKYSMGNIRTGHAGELPVTILAWVIAVLGIAARLAFMFEN